MKIKVRDYSEADLLKVNFLGKELELAHEHYKEQKNEIISKLYTIWKNDEIPAVYRDWIKQAARFIVESDMKW